MAKIADVFGRFEAFCLSILIYILGYVQMAASTNVQTYASAQIFYSAGSTGLQILQQVFIADSSDLLNRAFLALLPEFPFLVTVWLGPTIAGAVLKASSWRWGYGMWAIILPAAFLPLALSLLFNQRKAQRLNLIKPSSRPRRQRSLISIVRRTWYDLDVGGLTLLSAAVTLILVPLTLAAHASQGWRSPSIITMMVVGVVCLLILPFYESSKKLAPKPLLSLHLLKQRTALAGCALAFWYFSKCCCTAQFHADRADLSSGILFLRSTLSLFLSAGRSRVRCRRRWSRYPDLCIYLHHCCIQRLNSHQIYQALPNLRHHRMRHLHDWIGTDAPVPG